MASTSWFADMATATATATGDSTRSRPSLLVVVVVAFIVTFFGSLVSVSSSQ